MEIDVWEGLPLKLLFFFKEKKKNELTDVFWIIFAQHLELATNSQRDCALHQGKERKSLRSTTHDHASFVCQIFSPFSESPWETNDVVLFTPPPRCRADKAGSGTRQAKLMSACRDQRAGNKRGAKMKALQVKSDMCHSVMSFIPTSRVAVAAAIAWVRGWHQRHKLSDRLWKDLIPLCHCSPG